MAHFNTKLSRYRCDIEREYFSEEIKEFLEIKCFKFEFTIRWQKIMDSKLNVPYISGNNSYKNVPPLENNAVRLIWYSHRERDDTR